VLLFCIHLAFCFSSFSLILSIILDLVPQHSSCGNQDESNNFTEIEDPFFERGSRQGEADLKPQWLVLQSAFECALPVEMVRGGTGRAAHIDSLSEHSLLCEGGPDCVQATTVNTPVSHF
jgi:hypothetical protein